LVALASILTGILFSRLHTMPFQEDIMKSRTLVLVLPVALSLLAACTLTETAKVKAIPPAAVVEALPM